MTHHSAAVVQTSMPPAIQNTPGRRPCGTCDGGGASIASRRFVHQASTGTTSDASSATRQPACSTADSDSAAISTTYAMLAATLASVSATALRRPWWSTSAAWIATRRRPPPTPITSIEAMVTAAA